MKKGRGRHGLKAGQTQLGEPSGGEVALIIVPRSEQQHDALGVKPARRKDQRVGRWPVKPLRIID